RLPPVGDIPQPYGRFALPDGRQEPPLLAKRQEEHTYLIASEDADLPPRAQIPEANRPVSAAGGQRSPVGGEGQGPDLLRVSPQQSGRPECPCIPQADAPVPVGGCHQAAVGRERPPADPTLRRREADQSSGSGPLPEAHGVVSGPSKEETTVRRQIH